VKHLEEWNRRGDNKVKEDKGSRDVANVDDSLICRNKADLP
jgi:hypothetical protein